MKLLTFLFLIITILCCYCGFSFAHELEISSNVKPESYYQDQFREWMRKNNKVYSAEEFQRKYATFKENLIWINDFNKESCGCDHESPRPPVSEEQTDLKMGLNSFSDLTLNDFSDLLTISKDIPMPEPDPEDIEPEEPEEEGCSACQSSSGSGLLGGILNGILGGAKMVDETELAGETNVQKTLPNSVDWTHLTPNVRNQGECASCYAFGSTAALEAALTKKYKKQYDLSEQQIVDCSPNDGCKGGWVGKCFNYIKNNGLNTEKNYPYTGKKSSCHRKVNDKTGHITKFVAIKKGNEVGITRALANHGPVAVTFFCSSKKFQFYESGIFSDPECPKQKTDHIVVAVGYGVKNGVKFFKLKNSWGEDWGEKGFFRMKRGVNMCAIASQAAYPIV